MQLKDIHLKDLQKIANEIRFDCVKMCSETKTAHLGSCLSCVDLLTALYWKELRIDPNNPQDPSSDRFILSKGHACVSLYNTLHRRGYFGKEVLLSYATDGTTIAEHPGPFCVPGIEVATGSLGHGFPVACGMALGSKIKKDGAHIYVLLGDGECNEGSIWEGVMFASKKRLGNLVAMIDYNKWQGTGRSQDILQIGPLKEKWKAFGWHTQEIDGHSYDEILNSFATFDFEDERPKVIIANTIKGKGVSFMENDNNWHYRIATPEEVKQAGKQLEVLR